MTPPRSIDDVDAMVGITDDRVAMTAEGEATVYVAVPDRQPLAALETHATLRVRGEDWRSTIELDADDAAALHAALGEALDR